MVERSCGTGFELKGIDDRFARTLSVQHLERDFPP
jgi:hypothetical protein